MAIFHGVTTRSAADLLDAMQRLVGDSPREKDVARQVAVNLWRWSDPVELLHDFTLIQNFEPWVYEQNAAFEKVLTGDIRADDVIVTHHLPAFPHDSHTRP